MHLNKHYDLIGKHAFLSPSKFYWLNYDKDQLFSSYDSAMAAARGTKLHAMAKDLIDEGIRLRGNTQTLAAYVNDAIGYGMIPEQPLYFSENCFGTADALLFKKGVLRIHDLKTGVTPAHMEQLEIYAALFLMEYERIFGVNPSNTKVHLAIYQNDDVVEASPDRDRLEEIIAKIKEKDRWLNEMKGEVE